MSTYQTIKSEIISAMKSKDQNKLLVLRTLDSAIKNISIQNNNRSEPTEQETIQGISQMVKRCSDSAEQFKNANRMDLFENETFQMNVAKSFLPKQLSKEDVKEKISQELSGQEFSQKDFGKFMKHFGETFRGLTDNKTISEVIKEIISENGVK